MCRVTGVVLGLSPSLESRRSEFEEHVEWALNHIRVFSERHGWSHLLEQPLVEQARFFDSKEEFDGLLRTLFSLEGPLPQTYCGAWHEELLVAVSPEIYARAYPQGVEDRSYEKLLTHELAHALHVRILGGDEAAMGPIWFYEGFAVFVAEQFQSVDFKLNLDELRERMHDSGRGPYHEYGALFRHLEQDIPLAELIERAKDEDFAGWVISLVNRKT